MPTPIRRLAAFAFAAALAVGVVGVAPTPAAAAELTIAQAESEMVNLLNAERAKAGLAAVRMHSGLMQIARQRSGDMAAKRYFSHTQPDGRNVFDFISAAQIVWSGAGEIIAWNTWGGLAESARVARDGWMASPGHRSIVMSGAYNAIGIGLAIDPVDGRKLWTGVFITGPVVQTVPTVAAATPYRLQTVRWMPRASGYFQVQVRTDGGAYRWLSTRTRVTYRTIRVWTGHTYYLRVRPCSNAGTCRGWTVTVLRG